MFLMLFEQWQHVAYDVICGFRAKQRMGYKTFNEVQLLLNARTLIGCGWRGLDNVRKMK